MSELAGGQVEMDTYSDSEQINEQSADTSLIDLLIQSGDQGTPELMLSNGIPSGYNNSYVTGC